MNCDICGKEANKIFEVADNNKDYCAECFEDTQECSQCDTRLSDSYSATVDGEIACPNCCENAVICDNCSEQFSETYTVIIHRRYRDAEYCESCCERETFTCGDCGKYFDATCFDATQIDGQDVCNVCRANYPQCYQCEDYLSNDADTISDSDGDVYCEYCAEVYLFYCDNCGGYYHENCRSAHAHIIRDYSYNVLDSLNFLGKPNNGLYFGVELEVEAGRDIEDAAENFADAFDEFAILKSDGSLSNGFEIVTAPATLEIHKREWVARLTSKLTSQVLPHHSNCGLHIHVSRQPLSELTLAKLTAFLNLADNLPQVEKIAGRKCNGYSSAKKIDKIGKYKDAVSDRYSILNLKNSATIEFRIFAGIVDIYHIFRCLEFAAASVEFAKQTSLERLRFSDFIDFLVDCGKNAYPQLYKFYQLTEYKRNLAELDKIKKSAK